MAAVFLVDMAQAVQSVWARLDAGTSDAPPLSRGTRLLNDLAFSVASRQHLMFCSFQTASESETRRLCLTLAGLERTFGFRRSCDEFSERFEDVFVRRV